MFEHLPIKRRRVLRGFLVGGIIAWAAPFVYAASKFLSYQGILGGNTTAKFPASQLTEANPSTLVEVEGEPVIVIREPDNSIRAFTATCTHLGCIVSYRSQLMIGQEQIPGFYCRCHGGKFDSNGINVPGTPPKSPLTELKVTTSLNDLIISLTPIVSRT
ncbi:MAG TPA: Rieske 2Fe-2S domain-containing protein [Candidatus Kapabacteria bacterium]|nr:Rieske 2Fe-2S domain-containing protein [Candidatus Kapabacteria bacterium]